MFRVLDPDPSYALDTYNCVAYTLGVVGQMWGTRADEHWPAEIDRRSGFLQHLDAYLELFEHFGYRRCSEPFAFRAEHADAEAGIEKVALYARPQQSNQGEFIQCPHVARQLGNGRWSSKAQQREIFEHSLWALESDLGGGVHGIETPPEECLDRLPSGMIVGYSAQNYGRVALILARPFST